MERNNGLRNKEYPPGRLLEEFVIESLSLLHPEAIIKKEPLVVVTQSGKTTVPDISFEFPNSETVVLIEVTSSQRFYSTAVPNRGDPKHRQYTLLRTYEIENHKKKKYPFAVLYGQHFGHPLYTIAAFHTIGELAHGRLNSQLARKRLNNLAGRLEFDSTFLPTPDYLEGLSLDMKNILSTKTTSFT